MRFRQTVEKSAPAELPRYSWVNTHAWSWFKKAPGAGEDAEDMPEDMPQDLEHAEPQGGERVLYARYVVASSGFLPTSALLVPKSWPGGSA